MTTKHSSVRKLRMKFECCCGERFVSHALQVKHSMLTKDGKDHSLNRIVQVREQHAIKHKSIQQTSAQLLGFRRHRRHRTKDH